VSAAGLGSNWSGNYRYRASRLHHPRTLEQVQELVARGTPLRALGTRHSFTDLADSHELVALDAFEGQVEIDRAARTVTAAGEITYAQLAEVLNREGLGLHNLASLPHISVIGAVTTATHGSGDELGNLASAVTALELVDGTGEVVRARRGEDGFAGLVVGLGALGIVTRVTLEVEPSYEVRQRVYEGMPWETLLEHYDEVTARGESVSVFHRFGSQIEQVWVKTRVQSDEEAEAPASELFGAAAADGPRNPVLGGDPANCTEQLGVPGPWSERLPHFRSGFTPSSGEEIQSEFFVPREFATEAIRAILPLGPRIAPLLLVCELRTMAADELWLSPQYQRATAGIHLTWRREPEAIEPVLASLEQALAPFDPRPHWAKLFLAQADTLSERFTRMPDWLALRERLDPQGVFVNDWLRSRVLSSA
jgi:xylitol oxidase